MNQTSWTLVLLAAALALCFIVHAGDASSVQSTAQQSDGQKKERPIEVDDPLTELRNGLVAEYSEQNPSQPNQLPIVRVDAKPAFTWGTSSPHPRIKPGPFQVRWTGLLDLRVPDQLQFSAFVSGEVTLTVGKTKVLQGRGTSLEIELVDAREHPFEAGLYPIEIVFRSLPETPARLQLWWQGKRFVKEPLPASRLKHLTAKEPESLPKEALRVAGRDLIGKLGCAHCHRESFPRLEDPPPGPALSDLGERMKPAWLMRWLASPSQVRPNAHMPMLFESDRKGYTERWLITQYLLKPAKPPSTKEISKPAGDFRTGRQHFLGLGCIACHLDPEGKEPASTERYPLRNLRDRLTSQYLGRFLADPLCRYPDGRMPKLPMPPATVRDLVAYLLRDSTPSKDEEPAPPTANELDPVLRLHATTDPDVAGKKLLFDKGCVRCHAGLGDPPPESIPFKLTDKNALTESGCLSAHHLPRFELDTQQRRLLAAYLEIASDERHPSAFFQQQRLLQTQGCARCHQRDSDRPSPLEDIGRAVWTPHLYRLPFQRTPSLTQASAKFHHPYLQKAISEGVTGVHPDWYSYRMPAYGQQAPKLVQALIEGDGDLPVSQGAVREVHDPNASTLGASLIGFNGYGCVTCHVWKGKNLSAAEPSSVGPDLTTVHERIKPAWFTRYVNDPQRIYPGSPMPSIFTHGELAPLRNILDGDATRQKAALWAFLSAGKEAHDPQPKEPLVVTGPTPGTTPYVTQIPLQLPNQQLIEGIAIWHSNRDIILYDVGTAQLRGIYTHAALLRQSNVWRTLQLTGTPVGATPLSSFLLSGLNGQVAPQSVDFLGYEFLPNGTRLRWRYRFGKETAEWTETVQLKEDQGKRQLVREIDATMPQGYEIVQTFAFTHMRPEIQVTGRIGQARLEKAERTSSVLLQPDAANGKLAAIIELAYTPPAENKRSINQSTPITLPVDEGIIGPLTRPGYRAILYPRPKTSQNEDLVMPSAIAADPKTGKVFVASMKQGDLFAVDDPTGDGKHAQFRNCARGLFQDCFGMLHDGQNLYVLHRRNLSRLTDSQGTGVFNRVERVIVLPHAIGNAYDWAYGLVKDNSDRFLWTLAPHAHPQQQGAGSLVRFSMSGDEPRTQEIAFGFRNPLGWCSGPGGETFFTDNQGDWCAANKLCHIVEGQFYGYPNSAQKEHITKPLARTTVWVPYDWAKSINGMAYDSSEGKFGPFAGQFFLAELMHGGAIVRAQVEKVNGVYQGACFPFWGKGLLGPLTMAFDPKGRLWVGSVTTPGWMGQPDRGALFRLDYTGTVPFEIQSIHVQPRGFRLVFTKPLDAKTALDVSSYQMHHYRYEYTGAYGSPELDRTPVRIQQAILQADGRTVDLVTNSLVKDRVYLISANGIRSMSGEQLIHPSGAYTVNEIPRQ